MKSASGVWSRISRAIPYFYFAIAGLIWASDSGLAIPFFLALVFLAGALAPRREIGLALGTLAFFFSIWMCAAWLSDIIKAGPLEDLNPLFFIVGIPGVLANLFMSAWILRMAVAGLNKLIALFSGLVLASLTLFSAFGLLILMLNARSLTHPWFLVLVLPYVLVNYSLTTCFFREAKVTSADDMSLIHTQPD